MQSLLAAEQGTGGGERDAAGRIRASALAAVAVDVAVAFAVARRGDAAAAGSVDRFGRRARHVGRGAALASAQNAPRGSHEDPRRAQSPVGGSTRSITPTARRSKFDSLTGFH